LQNKLLHHFFLLLALGFAHNLEAQVSPRHSFKFDLVAPARLGVQLGYSIRQRNNNAVEFQLGYERHRHPEGVRVFNGDWHRQYYQEKTDTIVLQTSIRVGSSGWKYLGNDRPLSKVPTFVPHETFQLAGLYRIPFLNGDSPWHFFMQVGFWGILHRYYENRETLHVSDRSDAVWYYTNALGQERKVTHELLLYEQRRSIRLKNDWRAGVAYQMGVSRRLGKHWFVEGRLDLGMNIGPPPYETPEPPLLARRIPVKPALLVGWAF